MMVPEVGLEPSLCRQNRILSPARLPTVRYMVGDKYFRNVINIVFVSLDLFLINFLFQFSGVVVNLTCPPPENLSYWP